MLNFPTLDSEDKELLKGSFDALSDKSAVVIVSDPIEVDRIFRVFVDSLSLPVNARFSVANLFKVKSGFGSFYIAQCLYDYRFSTDKSGRIDDRYEYRVLGFVDLVEDFGEILIRPETKGDKVVGRFFKTDIQIADAPEFNKRYYLAAKDAKKAQFFVNRAMVNVLAKTRGVHVTVYKRRVFVGIEHEMNHNQTSVIEKVLRSITDLG